MSTSQEAWKEVLARTDIPEKIRACLRRIAQEAWAESLFPHAPQAEAVLLSTQDDHWKAVQAPGVQIALDASSGDVVAAFQDRFGKGAVEKIEEGPPGNEVFARVREHLIPPDHVT